MALPPEMEGTYRQWWQLVQHAATTVAEDGSYAFTSADLVSAASDIARQAGPPLSFQAASQLPTLFSLARGNGNASANLMQSETSSGIQSSMVGEWPTIATPDVFNAQPMYMARASFTYTNALGEESTGWVSMTGITQLPTSVGNLQARLQGQAMLSYSQSPEEGGSPKTDAEVLDTFGEFTSIQLYAI